MKGRAIRRHHLARMKAKAVRRYLQWTREYPNQRLLALLVETHCRPCSCQMCQKRHRRPVDSRRPKE